MKSRFLVLFCGLLVSLILSACGATASPTPDVAKETLNQTTYYNGTWRMCLVNVLLSPNKPSLEKAIDICKGKLSSNLNLDFYNKGRSIVLAPIPHKDNQFKSNLEYLYYLGVWEQCFSDVVMAGKGILTEAQMNDFCTNSFNQAIQEEWYSTKPENVPAMPDIEIKQDPNG